MPKCLSTRPQASVHSPTRTLWYTGVTHPTMIGNSPLPLLILHGRTILLAAWTYQRRSIVVYAKRSGGSRRSGGGKCGNKAMTVEDAARIQSSTAKASGGGVPADSFAARAQSAAARNTNKGNGSDDGDE